MDRGDVALAQAEARLERLDDERAREAADAPPPVYAGAEGFRLEAGFHVTDEDEGLDNGDEDHVGFDGSAAVIDAFTEVFNARDLDGLIELLAEDAELPGLAGDHAGVAAALEHLWQRRPTCLMTRGDLEGVAVGMLWELGDDGTWWRVAPVYVETDDDLVAVAEFDEDASARDAVEVEEPDDDREPGSTWAEWTDGVPAD